MKVAATGANQDEQLEETPKYLDVQIAKLTFELVEEPKRQEIPVELDVQMVVEYYAR
jgi:small subunit ribosomal protein S4